MVSERVTFVVERFDSVGVVVDAVVVVTCRDEERGRVSRSRARDEKGKDWWEEGSKLTVEEERTLAARSVQSRSNGILVDVWSVIKGDGGLTVDAAVGDDLDGSLVERLRGGGGEGDEERD